MVSKEVRAVKQMGESVEKENLPPLITAHYGRQKPGESQNIDPETMHCAVEALRLLTKKAIFARRLVETEKKKTPLPERLRSMSEDVEKVDTGIKDKIRAFISAKRDMDELINLGGEELEKAHRHYLRKERTHRRFRRISDEITQIRGRVRELNQATVDEVSEGIKADKSARIKASKSSTGVLTKPDKKAIIAGTQKALRHPEVDLMEVTDDELRFLFPKNSELTQIHQAITQDEKRDTADFSKVIQSTDIEFLRRAEAMRMREREKIGDDDMVMYLEKRAQIKDFVDSLERGERVLETDTTIENLNKLAKIERDNPNSTVGAVAVGEPGVGKSTAIRYYLAQKGRRYAYMDLSGEVTRYQFFGSPNIHHESPLDDLNNLRKSLDTLDDEQAERIIRKGNEKFGHQFTAMVEDSIKAEPDVKASTRLKTIIDDRLEDVIADGVYQAGKKNGWRDGFLIHCLKNNICPVLDEFNKIDKHDALFGLMDASPATDEEAGPMPGKNKGDISGNHKGWYYFSDNNEWIRVQKDWKIYLTGNVGGRHGTFSPKPALKSRIDGKIIEFEDHTIREQMLVAHSQLTDPDLEFRAPYGVAKGLAVLISEVFPKIKKMEGVSGDPHPVSLRTLDALTSKLFDRDNEVSKADGIESLDDAVLSVVVDPYAVEGQREIPKVIVQHCNEVGLLLSPQVEERVVSWLCEDPTDPAQREEMKKILGENRKTAKAKGVYDELNNLDRISVATAFQTPPGVIQLKK